MQQQQQCYKNDINSGNNPIHTNNNNKKNTNTTTETATIKTHSNKNGNRNDSDENSNNNKSVPKSFPSIKSYYNPYKSSDKNKAKRYFRHSLQHSVPMALLSSEYFSNSSLSL